MELSCFFDDPADVGNLISGSSSFSKINLKFWKFMVHILLKPGLENFEHYFISVWDACNCVVVWAFFGIAFLWDWNENWPFPVLWPLLSFWPKDTEKSKFYMCGHQTACVLDGNPLRKPVHCLCPTPGVGRAVVRSEACQVKIVFGQVRKITHRFFGQELDSWLPPKLIFCMCAPFYLLVLCKFQNAFMCIIILKSHKMKLSPLFIVGSLWDGLNGLFLPTMLRDSWKRSKIILFKEQAQ